MDRWIIQAPGTIRWNAARKQRLEQALVFPTLRTIPNNTHASPLWPCSQADVLFLESDGRPLPRGGTAEITFS